MRIMRNMRKAFPAIAVALALALLFTACGKDQPTNADAEGGETEATSAATVPAAYDFTDLTTEATAEGETADETTTEAGVTGETTADGESTSVGGTETATAAAGTRKLPSSKGEILALYTQVMNSVKNRQPTYTSYDYQDIVNAKELPKDVVDMLNTYFYKGGAQSLVPALESLLDTRALTAKKDAKIDVRQHRTGENGERLPGGKSNARWFGVSMNDKGCLATADHVKSADIRDLGGDRVQIDIVIADVRNPKVIDEGAATAPNALAAFMEVQDISIVFDLVNNAVTRGALTLAGVNLRPSSYMLFSNSTCRLVYNAKTMECESLYQVGRMTLNIDGAIKGVECTGHPIRIDCIYDYTKFDWSVAWPR